MTDRKVSRALILTGVVLDVLILLLFLYTPRSGMEAMGAIFTLYPLAAIRLLIAVITLILAIRRKHWVLILYTVFAMTVQVWFWHLFTSLSPTYEPLHKVLPIKARAMVVRFGDYLDQRAYDAKRARQHQEDPVHGQLCDLLSVARNLDALDTSLLDQDLNRPCATYYDEAVSPLLHAVIHTYGVWNGNIRIHPPVDEAFLGPAAERLLAAGANPDARDAFGNTALHYALTFQNEALVEVLLARGACVLLRNGLDESPLGNHSSHRLRQMVEAAASEPEMLANCPAEVRGTTSDDNAETADPRTPDAGLLDALRSGRLEQAISYLEQGADPDASDREGSSFEAALGNCRDNATTMAQLLIDAGGDVNGQDRKGATALMISMRYCVNAVPYLLQRGADPTVADHKGDTPLHRLGGVAPAQLDDIVDRLLAAGADINQQSATGQTPLIRSLFGGTTRARVSSALVSRRADLNLANNAGNTPLHILASRKRDAEAANLIAWLVDHDAALEPKNRKQQTPLVTAVAHGSPEAVRVLIKIGADVNARKARGHTMISGLVSCKPDKLEMLTQLVEAGADTSIPIEHGPLPLGQAFFGKAYLDCLEPAALLLESGANPNQKDGNGAAAIHGIAHWSEKDPDDALKLLRAHNADMDIKNQQGMTTLLLAARYGTSLRTMERLLTHGADREARDDDGNTLLHAAAMNSKDGNLERYDWVLALGGDPTVQNDAGQTPLDRARITGNTTLIPALEVGRAD